MYFDGNPAPQPYSIYLGQTCLILLGSAKNNKVWGFRSQPFTDRLYKCAEVTSVWCLVSDACGCCPCPCHRPWSCHLHCCHCHNMNQFCSGTTGGRTWYHVLCHCPSTAVAMAVISRRKLLHNIGIGKYTFNFYSESRFSSYTLTCQFFRCHYPSVHLQLHHQHDIIWWHWKCHHQRNLWS